MYLPKGMGLLTNSSRGVWSLTEEGTSLLTDPSITDTAPQERILELRAHYLNELRKVRKDSPAQDDDGV